MWYVGVPTVSHSKAPLFLIHSDIINGLSCCVMIIQCVNNTLKLQLLFYITHDCTFLFFLFVCMSLVQCFLFSRVPQKLVFRPRGLLVSLSYGTSSHIKANSTVCSYAQWYCKWVSAAVRCSYWLCLNHIGVLQIYFYFIHYHPFPLFLFMYLSLWQSYFFSWVPL